ncbi:ATP-binding protein [Sphaerisporangium krabiense]|nr:ATP-binding protein [Sphaerisporangium krabiense]
MYMREVLQKAERRIPGSTVDDIVLLSGEVVANAVKHSASGHRRGGVVGLLVHDDGRTVRVEVVDEGSEETVPQIPAQVDPLSEGGRGLWLVRELSSGWGWRQDGPSRVVWFEISGTSLK